MDIEVSWEAEGKGTTVVEKGEVSHCQTKLEIKEYLQQLVDETGWMNTRFYFEDSAVDELAEMLGVKE